MYSNALTVNLSISKARLCIPLTYSHVLLPVGLSDVEFPNIGLADYAQQKLIAP